jgi:hypothetical protein
MEIADQLNTLTENRCVLNSDTEAKNLLANTITKDKIPRNCAKPARTTESNNNLTIISGQQA